MHSCKGQRSLRFLITAGGTREYIDPVRFISNASSGRMGFALARAAIQAGHKVTLITTIENSKFKTCLTTVKNRNSKIKVVKVETSKQMFEAVKKYFPQCDCLIMAAAVADYTPVHPAKTKIKKTSKLLTIKLKPTVDILKWAGNNRRSSLVARHSKQLIVGFALEDKDLRKNAEKKLKEKNLDMIVANTLEAIGADRTTVQIKVAGQKWLKLSEATKTVIAKRIIVLIEKAFH